MNICLDQIRMSPTPSPIFVLMSLYLYYISTELLPIRLCSWLALKMTKYADLGELCLAPIFTIGHWLGAIKIRFGYIRLAWRTVSSAIKSQAANIVFVTPPEAKNSNSVGLYHQGLARNKCLTCKNRSGIPPKKHFIPWPQYLPLATGWGL